MTESSQQAELQAQQTPCDETPVAPPDAPILRDIETATETMALYTAIIGKKPQIVDPATEQALADSDEAPPPILTISPNWPQVNRQMISIWFRRMSIHARKRIDEALMRIAG
jgi:hypothetical protein